MENGIQVTLEMWMPTACPKPIVGVSEHHVKISPWRERERDLMETEVVSLEKYLESFANKKKVIDPNGLSMRMYAECCRATGGGTTSQFSWKWTNAGTISNGRISTQNITFPKTGSGYTLSDILEDAVPQKYFLSCQQTEKIVFAK